MASPQQVAPPQNWLQEWNERCPVVSRSIIVTTLVISLLGFIFPDFSSALILQPTTFTSFELWRIFTSPFNQYSVLNTVFILIFFAIQGPVLEAKMGSLGFLLQLVINILLINVLFCIIMTIFIELAPGVILTVFGQGISAGLFPAIMVYITTSSMLDPDAVQCQAIPNKFYPWFILALVSLLSFAFQLDLFLGILIGYGYHFNLLKVLTISPSFISAAELNQGIAVKLRMTNSTGYMYHPSTVLPPDIRLQREAAMARIGLPGFDRPAGENTQRAIEDGEASSSSGRSYLYQAGRVSSSTSGNAASSSTSAAKAPKNDLGEGHVLGRSTAAASSSTSSSGADARAIAAAAAEARAKKITTQQTNEDNTTEDSQLLHSNNDV
jgi:membrane associated rhomboid family serine protease